MENTSHPHPAASAGGDPAAAASAGASAAGQARASGGPAAPTAAFRQAQRRLGERRRPRRATPWSSKDVLRAAALVFGLYFGLQLLWLLHPLILTGFIGLLFGLGVSRGADHLERLHVPRGLSAALLVLGTYGAMVGAIAVAAPRLQKQFGELRQRLPEAVDRVDQWIAANRGSIWGQILEGAGAGGEAAPAAQPSPTPQAAPPARSKSRRGTHSAAPSAAAKRVESSAATADAPGAAAAPGTAAAAAGSTTTGGGTVPGSSGAATPGSAGAAPPGTTAGSAGAAPQATSAPPGGGAPGAAASTQGGARGSGGSAAPGSATAGSAAAGPAAAGSAAPGSGAAGTAAAGAKPSALRVRLAHQLGAAASYLFSFLSSTVEVLAGLLLITFVAIFSSIDPGLYRRGLLRLVPHPSRQRADEVLNAMGETLRRWLATQLIAMVLIGTLVWAALALLGVEAALSLGIIAGVLEFIPTVGSILASLPAIAMGFLVSPQKALVVAIVFTLVQLFEGHVLIPMLMKRGMNLPPLLTILGQAAMAVVFGFLGLLVAVPVVATILTAVKMLYVDDVVGDDVEDGAAAT